MAKTKAIIGMEYESGIQDDSGTYKRGFIDALELEDQQFTFEDNTVNQGLNRVGHVMKQSEINKQVQDTFDAMDEKYIRKDQNDSTNHDLTIAKDTTKDPDQSRNPTLDAEGNVTIGEDSSYKLTVNAESEFNADVSMEQDLTVDGDTTLGDLYVTGEAHFTNLTIDQLNSIEGAEIVSCAHAKIVKVDDTLVLVDYDNNFGQTTAQSHFNFYASLLGEEGTSLEQNFPCNEFALLVQSAMEHLNEEYSVTDPSTYFPSRIQNTSGEYTYTGFNEDVSLIAKAVRVYWKADYNSFKVGDFVYSHQFNTENSQHYWSLICKVGTDATTGYQYADILAKIDRFQFFGNTDYIASGSDTINGNQIDPEADQTIIQLGNNIDSSRQGAIVLSSYDTIKLDTTVTVSGEQLQAPYFAQYKGINDFSFGGHLSTFIARNANKFDGDFEVGGTDIKTYIDGKIVTPTETKTWVAFCDSLTSEGKAGTNFTISPQSDVTYKYMSLLTASTQPTTQDAYDTAGWFSIDTNTDITQYRLCAVQKVAYCNTSYTPAKYADTESANDDGTYSVGEQTQSEVEQSKMLQVNLYYKIYAIKGTTATAIDGSAANTLHLGIYLTTDSASTDIKDQNLVWDDTTASYKLIKSSTNFYADSTKGTYITAQLKNTQTLVIIATDDVPITFNKETLFGVYKDLNKIIARLSDGEGNIATQVWTATRIDSKVESLKNGEVSEISQTAARILATVKGSTRNLLSNSAFKVTDSSTSTGIKDWNIVNGGTASIVDATINGRAVKALQNSGGTNASGFGTAPLETLINTSTDKDDPDLYTISAWVKNVSNIESNTIYLTLEYLNATPLWDMEPVSSSVIAGNSMSHIVKTSDGWTRISCVVKATSGTVKGAYIYSQYGSAFQVAMPMLQKGSYATDWVNADTDYSSYIDMQKDSIDAGVQAVESSKTIVELAQTAATNAEAAATIATTRLSSWASDDYICAPEKSDIATLEKELVDMNSKIVEQYAEYSSNDNLIKDSYVTPSNPTESETARANARDSYNNALDTLATYYTSYQTAYANAINACNVFTDASLWSTDFYIGDNAAEAASTSRVNAPNTNIPYAAYYSYLSKASFFDVRTNLEKQFVVVAKLQKTIWKSDIVINKDSISLSVTKNGLQTAGIYIDGNDENQTPHIDMQAGTINLKDGSNTTILKVDSTGAEINGKVTATSGNIGGWDINENNLSKEDEDGSIVLLPSKLQGTDSLGTVGWQLNSDGSGFLARDAVSWNNNDGVTVKGNINASVFKVIDTSHSDRTLFEMTSLGLITDITAQQKASAGLDNADESTPILVCYQYATDGSVANRYIVNLTMIGGSALVNYKSFSIDCGAWDSLALMYNMDDYEQYEVPLEFQLTLKSKIYLPMFKSAGTYYSGDILALCDDSYYYSSSRVVPISTLIQKMYDVYLKISVSNGGILDLLTACLYNNKTLIDSNDLDDLFSLTLTMAYSDNFYEELLNIVPTYSSIKNHILSTINDFSNTSTTAKFNSIVSDIVSIVLAQGVGITSSIESVYGWEYNHNVVKRVRFHFTEYSDDADIFLTLFYTPDY